MNNNLTLDGELLIKGFEGYSNTAYLCPAGKWSICWGSTKDVKEGDYCTDEECQERFQEDIKWAKDCVSQNIQVPLTNNQFSALVSFVFNVGPTAFKGSTLLRLLNRGWYEQVPPQLMRWDKVNGESVGGLNRRRREECKLWSHDLQLDNSANFDK